MTYIVLKAPLNSSQPTNLETSEGQGSKCVCVCVCVCVPSPLPYCGQNVTAGCTALNDCLFPGRTARVSCLVVS